MKPSQPVDLALGLATFAIPLVAAEAFSAAEVAAVYRAIAGRRDMRHFAGGLPGAFSEKDAA